MKPRTSFGQHTLGREYFVSDAIWQAEHERIFFQSWMLAGHVSQLEKPGSYFLFEIERESVIVLRDGGGQLRAFHNHCRHRGSKLCQHEQGTLGATIQCPYHAWTFGLDGALRHVPTMSEVPGFDPTNYPLHTVALTEWEGFLFVNLAKTPPRFDDAMPGLAGRFKPWRTRELHAVAQKVYDVDANWKLIFHNFSECYHCPLAHPHLNRLTPFRNSENDLIEGPVLGGPMWMANPQGSMSMGGERCAPAFPDLTESERGRVYYYSLFPSGFLSFHPDYVMLHRAQPLSMDRTRVTCEWFFHPDAIAVAGFDPQPAIEFWDLTNRQDWELCANAHRGVTSQAWQPGPYSELESQLAAFDRQYLRALDGHALDARRAGSA
jgi:Rieske 2Fe-2S family protein